MKSHILPDHLDTPREVVDASGNLRWKWGSDAFGNGAPNENPAGLGMFSMNLRFPGQYADVETGLYYNNARYYDPLIGRYIQSDPIGLSAGINTYGYVTGNPLKFSDFSGLICTYNQTTGETRCVDDLTKKLYYQKQGYSGYGIGRNNSSMQAQVGIGPIPQGDWEIGKRYHSPKTGKNTMMLKPLNNNSCFNTSRNCQSFRLHGDNSQGNASTGCIILPPDRIIIPEGEIIRVIENEQ